MYIDILLYIKLNISFLIGGKCTMNFQNQGWECHLAADYRIIMSRTLKAMSNHAMYDCGAWFLRVIMSNSHVVCCLLIYIYIYSFRNKLLIPLTVMTIFFVQCVVKQLLDLVFVISRIIKVSVGVISLRLSALADNPYLDLEYSG